MSSYVSYASQKLPLVTGELNDYLDRVDPISRYSVFEHTLPDFDLLGLPLPPPLQPASNRKIGCLWYPTSSAQTWARAEFVVNEATLTAIRAALVSLAGSSTNGYVPAPLVLANDDGVAVVTVDMLMLPPLPLLGDEANGDRLYLLPLVDVRWSWWQLNGISGTLTSWTGLIAAIGTKLGLTISVPGSLAGLAAPSSRWASLTTAPVPKLLDAIAHSTGRRVVVAFDGSVTLQDYNSAATQADAEVALNDSGDYRRQAGGSAELVDQRKVVPATLRVRGAATNRDVTLSSLALTDFGGVTGRSGYTATLFVDATSLSAGEASVVAAEWFKWRLAGFDQRAMARFCAVTPNACWSAVEFTLNSSEHATRWYPPPIEVGFSNGSDATTTSGGGSSLETVNSDATQDVPATTKITANLPDGVRFDKTGTTQLLKGIDASRTQKGMVTVGAQDWTGRKVSYDSATEISGFGVSTDFANFGTTFSSSADYGLGVTADGFALTYSVIGNVVLRPAFYSAANWTVGASNTSPVFTIGGNNTSSGSDFALASVFSTATGMVFAVGNPGSLSGTNVVTSAGSGNRFAVIRTTGFGGADTMYTGIDATVDSLGTATVVGGIVTATTAGAAPTFSFNSTTGVLSWSIGGYSGTVTLCPCSTGASFSAPTDISDDPRGDAIGIPADIDPEPQPQ